MSVPDQLDLQKQDAPRRLMLRPLFIGQNGLRAGWRMLIFVTVFGALLGGFMLIANGGVQGVRESQRQVDHLTVTPNVLLTGHGIGFLFLCVSALVMCRIERRKFGEFGLPLRHALGKDFWIGIGAGFLAITTTLLEIFLLHGYRITGLALHGTAILSSIGAWGLTFIVVGLFEEFLCRGYLQRTLASGIGFWQAAFVMSGLFALGHHFNPHENLLGTIATGLFALLFCFFLRRTGNLWLPVGFHAAWDFGQTFYGVPDSGIVPYHNVFNSAFSGPQWLTGGTAGPEASVITPLVLLVVALIFNRYYRSDRSPAHNSDPILGAVSARLLES